MRSYGCGVKLVGFLVKIGERYLFTCRKLTSSRVWLYYARDQHREIAVNTDLLLSWSGKLSGCVWREFAPSGPLAPPCNITRCIIHKQKSYYQAYHNLSYTTTIHKREIKYRQHYMYSTWQAPILSGILPIHIFDLTASPSIACNIFASL